MEKKSIKSQVRFLVICYLFGLIACNAKDDTGGDVSKERAEFFFKMYEYIKNNDFDSVKGHVLNNKQDTVFFRSNYETAQRVLSQSNTNLIVADSVKLIDTTNNVHKYQMNFYDRHNEYVGDIVFTFYEQESQYAINFFAHLKPKAVKIKLDW